MTTTADQRTRTQKVLGSGSAAVLSGVGVTAVSGYLVAGSAQGTSALVGGGLAFSFFVFGFVVVAMATQLAPSVAMLIALLTYGLQFVIVLAVFGVVVNSDSWGDSISPEWLAAGLAVAAVAWSMAHLVTAARMRIPAYELADNAEKSPPESGQEAGTS